MESNLAAEVAECAHCIRFDERTQRFMFDHAVVSVKRIGQMLSHALITGSQAILLQFTHSAPGRKLHYNIPVSLAYVTQMLEFVSKNHWFWDEVSPDHGGKYSDHQFDPAKITPGLHFAEVQRLHSAAVEIEQSYTKHRGQVPTDDVVAGLKPLLSYRASLIRLSIPDYREEARLRRNRRRSYQRAMCR